MTGAEMSLDLKHIDTLDLGALTAAFERTIRSSFSAGFNPEELADSLIADVIGAVMTR